MNELRADKLALTVAYGSLTPSSVVTPVTSCSAASAPSMRRQRRITLAPIHACSAACLPCGRRRSQPARLLAPRAAPRPAHSPRAACVGHALPRPPMAARPLVARAPSPLATARGPCRACSRDRAPVASKRGSRFSAKYHRYAICRYGYGYGDTVIRRFSKNKNTPIR